jgi:bifunctional non-homologous end joining protein LigD
MLLTKADVLPSCPDWAYEAKYDGFRVLASVAVERVVLMSRHGNNFTDKFPDIAGQLPDAFDGHTAVIDGEIIAFDASGAPNFTELRKRRPQAACIIFDILEFDGKPIIDAPLRDRRQLLDAAVKPQTHIQISPMFAERDEVIQATQELGMEGVVAKRLSSIYRPGKRSRDWQKLRFADYPTGFNR